MIIIYKNRGILVPVYFIVSVLLVTLLNGFLKEYVGGVFASKYDFQIVLGIGFLISGIWTYLKSEDYVEINGEKEKVDFENAFFFITMKLWSKIMFVMGFLIIIGGILETIDS